MPLCVTVGLWVFGAIRCGHKVLHIACVWEMKRAFNLEATIAAGTSHTYLKPPVLTSSDASFFVRIARPQQRPMLTAGCGGQMHGIEARS